MRRALACVPLLCTLVAVPTAALARSPRGGSGGIGVTDGSSGSGGSQPAMITPVTSTTSVAPRVVMLAGVLNASGDGITLTAAASGTLGHPLTISGTTPTSDAGALIDIEATRAGHATWAQVATAQIAANGTFAARWTPSASAKLALRAVLAPGVTPIISPSSTGSSGSTGLSGTSSASTAAGQLVTSALTIPIFKDAGATMYGPGFWGHRTACGERLTRATLGVASRALKCGTEVAVLYRGRELSVPVIDRGPFGTRARWDLTMATAKALGIKQTVTIGTLTAGAVTALAARG
ncbi:MAG: hypothetical protein KGL15_05400 [Acidobacteriota bacterium]|nr:hypothetical protein [Acidobacteriota bacterium]